MFFLPVEPQQRWLTSELQASLGALSRTPAPADPLYLKQRSGRMTPMRFAIAGGGAAAALLLGGGLAAAASSGNLDLNHGALVSQAAHGCTQGTAADRDPHGDCVSLVARTNGETHKAAAETKKSAADAKKAGGQTDKSSHKESSTGNPADKSGGAKENGAAAGDAHGDAVSAAAQSHPQAHGDQHGDAVSAIAKSKPRK